jgi:hypothetical protein
VLAVVFVANHFDLRQSTANSANTACEPLTDIELPDPIGPLLEPGDDCFFTGDL